MPARRTITSPPGFLPLTGRRPVGTPAFAIPRNTLSTNRGYSGVPNLALKIWMQCGPHCGVAAAAGSAPTVQTPLAMVAVAAAANTLLLMDMNWSFLTAVAYWPSPVRSCQDSLAMKDSPPTFSPARRQENSSELRAPVPHHDLLSLPAGVAGNQDHNAAALTADLSGVILGETVVARRRRRSQSAGSHAASGVWTRIETDRFRACRAPSHPAPSTVTSSDRSERQHRP